MPAAILRGYAAWTKLGLYILTLAAYERARRALRVECEPNSASLRSRSWIRSDGSAVIDRKKTSTSGGLFSMYRGYEKDIFCGLH